MKYLMYETRDTKKVDGIVKYTPFIFTDEMVHYDMHQIFSDCPQFQHLRHNGYRVSLVSAATYSPLDGTVSGRSETLGLNPRPEDADIIRHCDYSHGMS